MTSPSFRALDDVAYGRVDQVSPSIRRVIAENPSKFTYTGTGTYIVGSGDVVVIDPGPRLDSHRQALATALSGERVRAILITHCHSDHSPLSEWLQAETGAPTFAYGPHPPPDPMWETLSIEPPEWDDNDESSKRERAKDPIEMEESTDFGFTPTHAVADGEVVVDDFGLSLTGVFTPGHTSNHMCWALRTGGGERALFTGDHVMGWSTTVVSPPDGDMAAYIESLRTVAGGDFGTLWPTHGPPREDGSEYVQALVDHRLERERGVLEAIRAGHSTIRDVVELLYVDVRRELHKVARRSVWGHVIKLVNEAQLEVQGGGPPALAATYNAT